MVLSVIRLIAALAIAGTAWQCAPTQTELARLHDDAQHELRRGRLTEAQQIVTQGLVHTSGEPDSTWAWRFRLLEADLLASRLDIPGALAVLEAPLPEGPGFELLGARQKLLLARMRVTQGQVQSAATLVEEALVLAKGDPALVLDSEMLRSQLLYRSGRWTDAEALLTAAETRASDAGDTFRQALALNNLGMGLVVRGRFDEALPYFERILALTDLEGTGVYGGALNNAGICYARLGQFERAVASQQKAIAVHENGRQQDYAQALGELGGTYLLQDEIARGIPYLQQALTIASRAGLSRDAALWAGNLAAASVALGRWDDAARFNEEAGRLIPASNSARRVFGTVTEAQIAAGEGRGEDAERLFREAMVDSEDVPAVRWMAYDGLARLASAARQPAEAARHFEAAVDTVEKARSALLRTDYRISFPTRLIYFYRGYVDLLIEQGRVERALEIADSSRGRVLAERQGIAALPTANAASLRRLARESRSPLVFYWLAPRRSLAWVVTGAGIHVATLPPGDEIEALVTEHSATIQNAMADPLSDSATAGSRLYAALVAPIERHLPVGSLVTIVPDGALHRLNFETLTTGSPKRYWIEDVTIQLAPSLAMLQRNPSAPAPASVLLVGNPAPRPPEFPALSYAPAEMTSVTRHFAGGAVTTIDGERASPAAFRDAQPGNYSVIHFTAHAVANTETPLDSAVILSGPDQSYKLYARDVAALPLAADLITVSACRSAGERAYSGEGLVGFAWAFLRAGSRRVVAGLWDVDDRSTALLMDHMYAAMATGTPTTAALRQAKLRLIKDGFPKPYYWAPFQVFTVVL